MTGTRGRPRSEETRRAILRAALELCERDGYQDLTIKAIADAAGAGRQTVYRWWPDKASVLMEALAGLAQDPALRVRAESTDVLAEVEGLLTVTYELTRKLTGQALVGLMADAQRDPALSERLQSTVIGPRRAALRALLARGVDSGEFAGTVPLDLVVDFAFGAMWYRLLSRHAPVDGALAREVAAGIAAMLGRR
ncbi:TetR/AcrR family transcriptional regulator [Nocardia implantans]|uniref:TetR/AcrR family transcriptional regulator n=1 Tax=Nocardia implantans TaxID=3108168 RepID=A0ABU6ASU5_9NOCA|nr:MULTISPECIES: TetR/AcrR family transcriptional regulator [unclassified Nocardia]MBF6190900.1 TetR/AcrR family transcriptional regulator [Nocardia beijingensis]MEA3528891.1 TetR/AcrR family transcriptional regulator [Nocardia sp. CDC192]MEB3510556.1 TetR/AcrR family transcriptional regulator [Nocardia sp. CDC186]